MRRIEGTDPLFEVFLEGQDRVLYHLTDTLRRWPQTQMTTDGDSYIAVQSSPDVPLWVMSRKPICADAASALSLHIGEALARNPRIRVFCRQEHMPAVLKAAAREQGLRLIRKGGLIAYSCQDPIFPAVPGQLISPPQPCHREAIARIAQEFTGVAEGHEMTDEEADLFAQTKIASPHFFVWEDGGQVVSMAQIADRGDLYARINTVGTLEAKRGRGYAGILTASLAGQLQQEGLCAMLYADADYPSSNRAYRKVGFIPAGELVEYGI